MKAGTSPVPEKGRVISLKPCLEVLSELEEDDVEQLRLQLKEATFLGGFIGAISATLEPNDVCANAARWLFDYVPYLRIIFSLAAEFDDKVIVFSPGAVLEPHTADDGTSGGTDADWPVGARMRKTGFSRFAKSGLCGRRYSLDLPEGMGNIVVYFEEGVISQFSDTFLGAIAESFSRALKNALAHTRVKEMAMRDSLTGLFNRRVFDEMLDIEAGRRELLPLSLLIIDLDNFKVLNDTHGHPAGDQVLATFGRILRESCRGSDLVARYGGEEFAIMLPNATPTVAFEIAQRLRNRFADTTFVFDKHQIRMTASVGIASCTGSTRGAGKGVLHDLVARADQALYRAKKNGKNQVYLYPIKQSADARSMKVVGKGRFCQVQPG